MQPAKYFLQCNNEYDFDACCHRKSKEAFEAAIQQNRFPSRFAILLIGIADTLYGVVYVAKKMCEVALYLWNMQHLKDKDGNSYHHGFLANDIGTVTLHLTLPFMCTAIRVASSAAGLLSPQIALKGWTIAESGEEYAYTLWSLRLNTHPSKITKRNVCQDIRPSSALFYLGEAATISLLAQNTQSQQKTEDDIRQHFTDLILHIYKSNPKLYEQLLHYDEAIKKPQLKSNGNAPPYILSHDTKQLLFKLKNSYLEDETIDPDEAFISIFTKRIFRELKPIETHRLFVHIHLNLQGILHSDSHKLDAIFTEQKFEMLADLFSTRLRFGRAHFPQATAHLQPWITLDGFNHC